MTRQQNFVTRAVTISAETQAKRIENLLRLHRIKTGAALRFAELERFMADAGAPLSKSTWHAMRDPSYRITKLDLLTSVAGFFGVDHDFLLLEEAKPTEEYERNLEEIKAKQVDDTVTVFWRRLRGFSSEETAEVLVKFLEKLPRQVQEGVSEVVAEKVVSRKRSHAASS